MYDLFGGVFTRFQERISMDRLDQTFWDEALCKEIMERNGQLSRYMEGHSHSDEFGAQKPTPAELKQEIELFEEIRKRHKDLKKTGGQAKAAVPSAT